MSDDKISVFGGVARLTLIAVIAATIVGLAWQITRKPIAANQHERRMQQFRAVLGEIDFDSLDYEHPEIIPAPHSLPGDAPAEIFRVLNNERIVAWIFVVEAAGYNAPIRLMIGINRNREVIAVRVLTHAETPGLADLIEIERSAWITSFDGRRLETGNEASWALRQDGGTFEAFTGASITPRALVHAVRDTLAWMQRHPESLESTR